MSTDLRNSIYLWIGGIAAFGLFWALSHFDVVGWVPASWHWPLIWIMIALGVLRMLWDLYRWSIARIGKGKVR